MEIHHAYRKIDRTSFPGAKGENSPCDGVPIHQPAFTGYRVDASSVVTLRKVKGHVQACPFILGTIQTSDICLR